MALRLDKLDAPVWLSTKAEKTSEGYLKGRAVITSTGIFEYLNSDGTIARELRLPEEVFKQSFLDSLKMIPITLSHPTFTVDAKNVKQVQIGTTGSNPSNPQEGTSDNHFLSIDFVIHDGEGISQIEKGTRALSVGYGCDLEKADVGARWCGQAYDYIQRNLKANHLSVVDSARQGDQAKIRFDSADTAVLIDSTQEETGMAEAKDMVVKIDASEIQEVVKTANERADGLQTKLDTLTAEKSKVEAERDTLKDKVDGLEKKVTALEATHVDEAVIKAAVERRVKILDAARIGGVEVKDGMSELDIQKAVIAKAFPKAVLDGKDVNYIDARFDGAVEAFEAQADAQTRVAGADDVAKVDNADAKVIVDSNKAREKMYADLRARNAKGGV